LEVVRMTPEQLQRRLDRLERRQSWTLRALGAGSVVLAAGALMAQAQSPPRTPPGTHSLPIAASRFELVDAQGQTRGVLRMDKNAPVLQLHDATGAVALKLTVRGADGAIEYVDGGEVLNLMKPAPRVRPLTSR
jgi:hypothetical protein